VRRRRDERLHVGPRLEHPAPSPPNERWSVDFVQDRFATGRAIHVLTVVGDGTRQCSGLVVDTSLPSARVIAQLERLGAPRGLPARLVYDHGSELSSRTCLGSARDRGIRLDCIRPGTCRRTPVDNADIQSFDGKRRDECASERFVTDLTDAWDTIERWPRQRKRGRPHRNIGQRTPAGFAVRFAPRPDLLVFERE
jgi:putative transposase